MNPFSRRVTLVSGGQLATCPRMLKVADALHEEGYLVRAVTQERANWATRADAGLLTERPWLSCVTVDTRREAGISAFWPAAVRFHGARRCVRALGLARAGAALRRSAALRSSVELLDAVSAQPTDFLYFCGGSFPIASEAARRLRVPYAVDFEDFHSGQYDDTPEGRWESELTAALERDAAGGARFVTMGSPLIAARYRERDSVVGAVIHNVFPLPECPPAFSPSSGSLKLYWFSQTIGPGRGLETAIEAIAVAGIAAELHLRGAILRDYRRRLEAHVKERAPKLLLEIHEPRSPAEMIACCRDFDVGLALETAADINNGLALSNKVFTYVLGGLAIAFSDTEAQRAFRNGLGEHQALFAPDDPAALADWLKRWDADRHALVEARRDAWEWAKRRWHWEHEGERGAVVRLFREHVPELR